VGDRDHRHLLDAHHTAIDARERGVETLEEAVLARIRNNNLWCARSSMS
jgi:hypothetical protein